METEVWMSNLSENILDKPLNLLAIPGSHDSFTCEIDSISDIGPDARDGASKVMNYFGYYGKSFMGSWIITQNIDATEQLFKGIRYFDLRIGKSGSTLCVTHQLFSGPIGKYLNQIHQFLVDHCYEVVLLDFNHIYLADSDQILLISLINEIFGKSLAPYSQYTKIPSLSDLRSHNHQVIVFYHCSNNLCQEFWPGNIIPTYWPNTTNPVFMIEFLNEALKQKTSDKFHICQGILTPTSKTLVFHPFSSLHHHLADKATPATVHWLSNELSRSEKSLINIVIVDFAQDHNFVDAVLHLNSIK